MDMMETVKNRWIVHVMLTLPSPVETSDTFAVNLSHPNLPLKGEEVTP